MKLVVWGEEFFQSFKGAYQHQIELTIFPRQTVKASHVVALALYRDKLLFTRHKERGLEWPGGKVEASETPLEAVIREIKEETGAIAQSVWLVGQYKVIPDRDEAFVKNIYVVEIDQIVFNEYTGDDTLGPVLLNNKINPTPHQGFSPLVCDGVFQTVRQRVLLV
jgi:8-oxo-dGTP diphosphatase